MYIILYYKKREVLTLGYSKDRLVLIFLLFSSILQSVLVNERRISSPPPLEVFRGKRGELCEEHLMPKRSIYPTTLVTLPNENLDRSFINIVIIRILLPCRETDYHKKLFSSVIRYSVRISC